MNSLDFTFQSGLRKKTIRNRLWRWIILMSIPDFEIISICTKKILTCSPLFLNTISLKIMPNLSVKKSVWIKLLPGIRKTANITFTLVAYVLVIFSINFRLSQHISLLTTFENGSKRDISPKVLLVSGQSLSLFANVHLPNVKTWQSISPSIMFSRVV